ncbi:hypothetical protein RJ639_042285 [Escallonia herrerae]|uniref:Auxin-responsive protein n=1 Tax=Escallonia herrerae TaxID=1293975 RepID=A0AA88WDP2_9ASTE|nr:hypothetical protein RJ639_042285 [Escallonia herrerae]
MELQLGLALPSVPFSKGFDLNSCGYEAKEVLGGFDSILDCNVEKSSEEKKRSFDEAFDVQSVQVPETLPLLVWNQQTEHNYPENSSSSITRSDEEEEEDGIIGWPPIKYRRKKLCHGSPISDANCWTVGNGESGGGGDGGHSRGPNPTYVKVKMEGVTIARKVDLSLHHSYQTLTHTLVGMFGRCQEDVKAYKLTYQDNDGDWLLAGDVPWGTFVRSVQRLKVLNNGD